MGWVGSGRVGVTDRMEDPWEHGFPLSATHRRLPRGPWPGYAEGGSGPSSSSCPCCSSSPGSSSGGSRKPKQMPAISRTVLTSKGHSQSIIRTGKLSINLDTKSVEGQRLHLTGKEYAMLELLSLRKGTTLTKEMFLNHLYGGMDEPELKIIDVFVCKLRKKIATACEGQVYIETVWGRGYVLRDPVDEAEPALSAASG